METFAVLAVHEPGCVVVGVGGGRRQPGQQVTVSAARPGARCAAPTGGSAPYRWGSVVPPRPGSAGAAPQPGRRVRVDIPGALPDGPGPSSAETAPAGPPARRPR
ncbi:hypothetical protein SBD_3759 [Streptomyces bottropensis ATCC 25435]|uniref:Uncharacterized protein n=1 Tax=Streptomyces bottropensis ATCC 25435 TaxID=1054862 RepID=M3ED22_9ACTN|nr:hypothetical protein SBD_3759 [Streptomyces bottropensis ATCC 25435]